MDYYTTPHVNLSLGELEKSTAVYLAKFKEVCEQLSTSVQIYTDGSVMRGRASAAAVSPQEGTEKAARLPGGTSPFDAELYGLLLAMELIEGSSAREFVVFSDAQSVMKDLRDVRVEDHPILREDLRQV